jgi:hypothetical protein|tara:strand:- start:4879 stop:5529 length:651 start_codon:yes stop_codon:yes gene_type:complete
MDIQRLRNLTTGRLHTEMGHLYEDLRTITGEEGLMTHMLPRAMRAVEPWLREHVTDPRFWDDKHDTTHTGEVELPVLTDEDRAATAGRQDLSGPGNGEDAARPVVQRLFIPLRSEYYEAFVAGTKTVEYRKYGPRWNEKTCLVGRGVTISNGYGKQNRRTGVIVSFTKEHVDSEAWIACYGEPGTAACIGIKLDETLARYIVDTSTGDARYAESSA